MNLDPKVLLDLLGPEYVVDCERQRPASFFPQCNPVPYRVLLVSWVPQERKETWVIQDRWERQGPEAPVETWERR